MSVLAVMCATPDKGSVSKAGMPDHLVVFAAVRGLACAWVDLARFIDQDAGRASVKICISALLETNDRGS
jgi:hypothetical protein